MNIKDLMTKFKGHKAKKKQDKIDSYLDTRVKLYVLTYEGDEEGNGEYTNTVSYMVRRDLPREAVHVSGEKNAYFIDKVKCGRRASPDECTAVDLCYWMENNDIDDALALKWSDKFNTNMDMKKVIIIGVALIVAVIVLWPIFIK